MLSLSGSYFSKFLFDPGSTSSSFRVPHFYFRLWFSGLGPILSSKASVHLGSRCWHGSKAQADMIPFQGFADLSLSCPRKHCSVCLSSCVDAALILDFPTLLGQDGLALLASCCPLPPIPACLPWIVHVKLDLSPHPIADYSRQPSTGTQGTQYRKPWRAPLLLSSSCPAALHWGIPGWFQGSPGLISCEAALVL